MARVPGIPVVRDWKLNRKHVFMALNGIFNAFLGYKASFSMFCVDKLCL